MKSLKYQSLVALAKQNEKYEADESDILAAIISSVNTDESAPNFNEIGHKNKFGLSENKLKHVHSQVIPEGNIDRKYKNGVYKKKTEWFNDEGEGRLGKERELWFAPSGVLDRSNGPVSIEYYPNGNKRREIWANEKGRHRVNGPAHSEWYISGQPKLEEWWVNGKYRESE